MAGKSKFLILSLVILAVILAIIIIVKATNGPKLSGESAKLAAEKRATLNFLQPTPTPSDTKAAQEIIESDPDIVAYMKESTDKFKVVLRQENSICLQQLKLGGRVIFEFYFDVNFEEHNAYLPYSNNSNNVISLRAKILQLVLEEKTVADLIVKSNHYFLFHIVTGDYINEYTIMVEEFIGTDFDKASKRISQRFFDVDLEKNTVIKTEAPT